MLIVNDIELSQKNLVLIDSKYLMGVCVYVNVSGTHYIPIDGQYLQWEPVKNWKTKYECRPHSTVMNDSDLMKLIEKVQHESSNFTYKTNN